MSDDEDSELLSHKNREYVRSIPQTIELKKSPPKNRKKYPTLEERLQEQKLYKSEDLKIFNDNFKDKIYIQAQWTTGYASYHFESINNIYINWKGIAGVYLDNGKKFPDKCPFTRTYFDSAGYFHGEVDFAEFGTYKGYEVFYYRFKEGKDGFLEGFCNMIARRGDSEWKTIPFQSLPGRDILCYMVQKPQAEIDREKKKAEEEKYVPGKIPPGKLKKSWFLDKFDNVPGKKRK